MKKVYTKIKFIFDFSQNSVKFIVKQTRVDLAKDVKYTSSITTINSMSQIMKFTKKQIHMFHTYDHKFVIVNP